MMPALATALNRIHNSAFSVQFWVILTGYWFRQYLDVLYDRHQVLLSAQRILRDVEVVLTPESDFQPQLDTDSYSVAIFTDIFNHRLFSRIIRKLGIFHESTGGEAIPEDQGETVGRRESPATLKWLVFFISCLTVKFNSVVLTRTYFSRKLLAGLSLKFLSIPLLGTPRVPLSDMKVNVSMREELSRIKIDNSTEFESLALDLLPENIPVIFMEGFRKLMKYSGFLVPYRAKAFLTANAFAAQEIYKVWVALGRENESAAHVILQHGANYGHSRVMSEEEFETATCTAYLTTGWSSEGNNRIIPFVGSVFLGGIGDYRRINARGSPTGKILWVLASLPRYQYTQWSAPQGPSFINYLDEQCRFLNSLSAEARNNLLCRPYHYDYGWDDLKCLVHHCGSFEVDRERKPLREEMKYSRLVVFTYDSTSMMESMAMNIPTICFWDESLWSWRDSSLGILMEMKNAGIFHGDSGGAAHHISSLISSNGLEDWWSSRKVQQVRDRYCREYANTVDYEYETWLRQIKVWV